MQSQIVTCRFFSDGIPSNDIQGGENFLVCMKVNEYTTMQSARIQPGNTDAGLTLSTTFLQKIHIHQRTPTCTSISSTTETRTSTTTPACSSIRIASIVGIHIDVRGGQLELERVDHRDFSAGLGSQKSPICCKMHNQFERLAIAFRSGYSM